MVRRLGLGKNNHLTYTSLALNPRMLKKSFYGIVPIRNRLSFAIIRYEYLLNKVKRFFSGSEWGHVRNYAMNCTKVLHFAVDAVLNVFDRAGMSPQNLKKKNTV